MVSLLLKCLAGAMAVLVIAALAKSKNYFLAGLVPLFPTFALIAHWIVGTEGSPAEPRTTALFGLCSLVPYAVYLGAVYLLSHRLSLWPTLLSAAAAWTLAAALLVGLWQRLHRS